MQHQNRSPPISHTQSILAQRSASTAYATSPRTSTTLSRGRWAVVAVLGFSGVAAFGLAPDTVLETVPTRTIVRELALPALADRAPTEPFWREERVQRGDTIGSLLARAGASDPFALAFLRTAAAARPLYRLRPGRPVHVAIDEDGELVSLRFRSDNGEHLRIERTDQGFAAAQISVDEQVRTTLKSGEIRTSLFAAADAAGIPDAITLALADIFGGDIDFYLDVQRGDRFSVLYETRYVDGEPVGTGRVIAAEFANRGRLLRTFFWRNPAGDEGYFAEDGMNTRKAFLRSPMELSRITSGFSLARQHPIFNDWRAHRGIDYAAPTGSPVRATADGVVTFAGVQGGYGNVVFLRHHGSFSTVYAHLSRFAPELRNGTRVRQGETIGFVGMTGWATGPHLHYEFRIAQEPRDPLTIALPTALPIAREHLAQFRERVTPLVDTLALARALPGATFAAGE
ncbi:MAG: peptidoglycan DD-metalloendopeptidase family protein [Betaproteobacteria bacterium]|nr:peptidoglycan DD-metalloendopeptidase family protein [Betaproteobacteria bacterium]